MATQPQTQQATGRPASTRPLKLGFIGIGVGAGQILAQAERLPEIQIAAGADINPRVLQVFKERYPEAKAYASAEELCADPDVEAVWVATPNYLHCPHVVLVANSGKHVVSEKPMALSMDEAEQMVDAADKNGVKMLCGHTLGFSPPVRMMRRIVKSGQLGPVKAINSFTYTDWMLNSRQPEELDESRGGGLLYRQAPHQVDSIRLLGDGMAKSVSGVVGNWWPERAAPGYYSAFVRFENGATANIVNNGYGYALMAELVPWGNEKGILAGYGPEERAEVRRQIKAGTRDEMSGKDALRIGGSQEFRGPRRGGGPNPWIPAHLGILIVTCERGDIRQSQYGLYVYRDGGKEDVPIEGGPYSPGAEDLLELHDAIVNGAPVYHDGRWGMATLELILAIRESSRSGKEYVLTHQVPMHPAYE